MFFVLLLIKLYIIVLYFRYVATNQELIFNPVGKVIAYLTSPFFKNIKLAKEQSDRYIPLMIFLLILLAYILQLMISGAGMVISLLEIINIFALFFMQFFIISVLLGGIVNKQYASYYLIYFFRVGIPFIKFTSFITRIKSKWVMLPTVIIIFGLYIIVASLPSILNEFYKLSGNIFADIFISNQAIILKWVMSSLRVGLFALINLLVYLSYLIIARALLSWVSPNPTNPIVQIIYVLTEPILLLFRRFIPPLGMLDLSAFVAIIAIYFLSQLLHRLVVLYV